MKCFSFLIFLTLFLQKDVISQNEKLASSRAQTIYGEFGGNGILFSGNYDCRILKSQKGFGIRVGFGFFGGSEAGILTVPIGIN